MGWFDKLSKKKKVVVIGLDGHRCIREIRAFGPG